MRTGFSTMILQLSRARRTELDHSLVIPLHVPEDILSGSSLDPDSNERMSTYIGGVAR